MAIWESQGLKRSMKITLPVLLILNVIVGSIGVGLVVLKPWPNDPSLDSFILSLEKAYDTLFDDLHPSVKRTSKERRSSPSLEFLSLLKPVVNLSGLDFHQPVKEDIHAREMIPIRNWAVSEGSERNLKYNGMTYQTGRVIAPVTGVYHIYSHVKFYVEDNKKGEKQDAFSHGIFRYNASTMTEEVLLSNNVTECKEGINDGAHLEYPSDVRGVVQLNAGDNVIVKISHLNLLRHDRDWHYVGAYLI